MGPQRPRVRKENNGSCVERSWAFGRGRLAPPKAWGLDACVCVCLCVCARSAWATVRPAGPYCKLVQQGSDNAQLHGLDQLQPH
eukprot:2284800-Alexandrium_andersonii.AAC.1